MLVDKNPPAKICKPKKPGKNVIFGKFKYRLNANIGTQSTHMIKYGVVAARIRFQPLQGQHASLWLQPNYLADATTTGREVDIIEWFGKDVPNGGLTSFIYAPSLGGDKLGIGPKKDGWIKDPDQYLMNEKDEWYKRYHVFSVEWTPSAYIFRIDGQETGRITKRVGSAVSSTRSSASSAPTTSWASCPSVTRRGTCPRPCTWTGSRRGRTRRSWPRRSRTVDKARARSSRGGRARCMTGPALGYGQVKSGSNRGPRGPSA